MILASMAEFNFGPIAFMGVCDVMTDAQEHIYLYLFMKQYFRQAVSQGSGLFSLSARLHRSASRWRHVSECH